MFSVQPFVTCKGLPTQLDRFGALWQERRGKYCKVKIAMLINSFPSAYTCATNLLYFFFFFIFLPPPVSLGMTKIRGTAQAEQSGDKVGEVGLRWFGHDERWRIYWTKDVDDGAC